MLGGIMVWLGLTGHIFFNRRGAGWMVLSAAVVLWGLRSMYKPGQWWLRKQILLRGISLMLLGLVLLSMVWAPFLWVGKLLGLAGVILAVRGVLGAALAMNPQ